MLHLSLALDLSPVHGHQLVGQVYKTLTLMMHLFQQILLQQLFLTL
jgi:hypothetical protein